MKHFNIPIFIPHNGCPHQCSFCNQREITGQSYQPDNSDVEAVVKEAVLNLGDDTKNAEIAFFGGSFTAIDRKYMLSLLEATVPYIEKFKGIRISTRPDYIDEEVLSILKSYKVTTIELGAQSMDNRVLKANNRGHNREDVIKSSHLIKEKGFDLGLQMMTGLYMATPESDMNTVDDFLKLNPVCVRVYPTVILKNTELASLYNSGKYIPYTLEQSVDLCSKIILKFYIRNIDVIRLGLHYSDSLVENCVYDNYHPAFKELCESRIFFDMIKEKIRCLNSNTIIICVNPKSLSKMIGQNKCNIAALKSLGYNVLYETDTNLDKYEVIVKEQF